MYNTVQIWNPDRKSPRGEINDSLLDLPAVLVHACSEGVLGNGGEPDIASMRFLTVLKEIQKTAPYFVTYLWGKMAAFGLIECFPILFCETQEGTPYFLSAEKSRFYGSKPTGEFRSSAFYSPNGYVNGCLSIAAAPERIGALLNCQRIDWGIDLRIAVAAFGNPPELEKALRSNPFEYENRQSRYLYDSSDFLIWIEQDHDLFQVLSRDLDAAYKMVHRALKDTYPRPRFIE